MERFFYGSQHTSRMKSGYVWGKKLALVIVDPQRKFSLNIPEWESRRDSGVKGINRFARIFRENGAPVVFIHFDGASHTGYAKDDGDEWLEGMETADSDIVVHKTNMSCFKQTDLEEVLKSRGVDCAIYVGMLTEYCVISTYFGSSERSIFPYLGEGALIPYNSNGNEAAELICNTLSPELAEKFLKGEQPEIRLEDVIRIGCPASSDPWNKGTYRRACTGALTAPCGA